MIQTNPPSFRAALIAKSPSTETLAFGELLPPTPGWLEQAEYEERNSVGFRLERLAKKVGEVFPREMAIAAERSDSHAQDERRLS